MSEEHISLKIKEGIYLCAIRPSEKKKQNKQTKPNLAVKSEKNESCHNILYSNIQWWKQ